MVSRIGRGRRLVAGGGGAAPRRPAVQPRRRHGGAAYLSFAGAALWLAASAAVSWAITPDSPEVRQLVESGLKALEEEPDDDRYGHMLGGKCLAGLAFVKAGRPDHPRVLEAVEACRQAMTPGEKIDVYSNGLAVILLCELNPRRYAKEIEWYLHLMLSRQKQHGGWGYDGNSINGNKRSTGDTSQTQYATLCYWTAHHSGYAVDADSLESVADWLLRTQDPGGCWGYQGKIGTTADLVPQSEQSCSMLAAGLGSILICAELMSDSSTFFQDDGQPTSAGPAPSALRPANQYANASGPATKIRPRRTNTALLLAATNRANGWMKEHYRIDIGLKSYYYLYGLERYQSFQELLDGQWQEEPQWYNDGFEFLKKRQDKDGSWSGYCGRTVDTAFAVLFLMRSTQKSIKARLGEGLLLSGRGLPTDLSRVRMRHGQIVVQRVQTQVDQFLALVDDEDIGRLDELADDPSQLMVAEVDAKTARQLQQLVRGGEPEVRLLAVRALGRTGNLDYVPSLIYALSDPDRRIVLEARDGLRFVSRRFDDFGLPDSFTEQQRFEAISAWKEWYLSLRPGAILEP
jgi:hypothetical protein